MHNFNSTDAFFSQVKSPIQKHHFTHALCSMKSIEKATYERKGDKPKQAKSFCVPRSSQANVRWCIPDTHTHLKSCERRTSWSIPGFERGDLVLVLTEIYRDCPLAFLMKSLKIHAAIRQHRKTFGDAIPEEGRGKQRAKDHTTLFRVHCWFRKMFRKFGLHTGLAVFFHLDTLTQPHGCCLMAPSALLINSKA